MYIKRTGTTKLPSIDLSYRQVFKSKTSDNQTVHKTMIANKIQSGFFTQEDIEILKFIFKFGCVSLEQIYRFVSLLVEDNSDVTFGKVEANLEKLVNLKIIHKYMLAVNFYDNMRDDAFFLYCLNAGGAYVLKYHSDSEEIINWAMFREIKDASKILKSLTAAEFYLDIHETCPEKLEFFDFMPELKVGKFSVVPSFIFCLNRGEKGSKLSYFIGEIYNDAPTGLDTSKDNLTTFSKKIGRIEEFLQVDWNKKYGDEAAMDVPMLLVIGNPKEDMTAIELMSILSRVVAQSGIDKFRLSSLEFINHRDLSEAGVLFKYKPEENKMVKIRAANFKRVEEK